MQTVKKAVVLAAGFGTRFLPFSKAISKTMLPIVDKPAIQLVVEEARASGATQIFLVVGANSESIIKHFSPFPALEARLAGNPDALAKTQASNNMGVKFIFQHEPNGTAGAILLAKNLIGNEPFLLLFADDIIYAPESGVCEQLVQAYNQTQNHIIGVQHVARTEAPKYGCVEFSKQQGKFYTICGFSEKPELKDVKSTLVSMGRFLMKPSYFDYLEQVAPNQNGERSAADALINMCKHEAMTAYEFEGKRYDTGDKFGYMQAVIDYGLRHPTVGAKLKPYLQQLANQQEKH